MIKSAIILFLILFLTYLPFSRVPDYFDSETTPAIIEQKGNQIVASFIENKKAYQVVLDTNKFKHKIGQRVEIIYELSQPEHAKLKQAWGYWWQTKELLFAGGIFMVLLGVAFATTHKPHPDALKEQLDYKKENTSKYD